MALAMNSGKYRMIVMQAKFGEFRIPSMVRTRARVQYAHVECVPVLGRLIQVYPYLFAPLYAGLFSCLRVCKVRTRFEADSI